MADGFLQLIWEPKHKTQTGENEINQNLFISKNVDEEQTLLKWMDDQGQTGAER